MMQLKLHKIAYYILINIKEFFNLKKVFTLKLSIPKQKWVSSVIISSSTINKQLCGPVKHRGEKQGPRRRRRRNAGDALRYGRL